MTRQPSSTQKITGIILAAAILVCSSVSVNAGKSLFVPSEKIHSIGEAMSKAGKGDTIWVENGVYNERIVMNPGVVLKARNLCKAVLDGGRRGTVVTMGRRCSLIGFEIRNGTFGVFTSGNGNNILLCRIVNNSQTGIINVRNLAKIEDNIIAFNDASGIQVWDVGVTSGSINHNTIAFNGNHGIAIGGRSSIIIENNAIVFNDKFGVTMDGASADWKISANNLFGNMSGFPRVPEGNFAIDPGFVSPRLTMDFRLAASAEGKELTLDREVSGARMFLNWNK